jgi:ABC-type transporter Mla subunit MlaD
MAAWLFVSHAAWVGFTTSAELQLEREARDTDDFLSLIDNIRSLLQRVSTNSQEIDEILSTLRYCGRSCAGTARNRRPNVVRTLESAEKFSR